MMTKKRISLVFSFIIIIVQLLFIKTIIIRDIPSEELINYSEQGYTYYAIKDNTTIIQKLDILNNERKINWIDLKIDNDLFGSDIISVELRADGMILDSCTIDEEYNLDTIRLEIEPDLDIVDLELVLLCEDVKGDCDIAVVENDYLNMGTMDVNGEELSSTLALSVNFRINNIIWDTLLVPLLAIVGILFLVGLFIAYNKEECIFSGRLLFVMSCIINLLLLIIIEPHFLSVSHMAENSLDFYYLTEKYPIYKSLFMMDAGYLPLLQRLIAIVYVKVFRMGVNSLYAMQLTGMIFDIVVFSSLNLDIFKNKGDKTIRFAVSTALFLLYINPTVSTYFNFVYVGYFLIALLLTSNLEELKKSHFILLTVLSVIICMSKGLYAVMLPIGVATEIFWWKTAGKRKKIYAAGIAIGALLQLLYAFIVGGSYEKWFSAISIKKILILAAIAIIAVTFALVILIKFNDIISNFLSDKYNVIVLGLLAIGSFMIVTLAVKKIEISGILNWSSAWYIPTAFALILLLAELSSNKYRIVSGMALVCLSCVIGFSLDVSNGKIKYCYEIVDWSVYKNYFDTTCVPVFKDAERFGTLADGLTLYYTNYEPADNYAYGAPYEFVKLNEPFDKEDALYSELNFKELSEKEISAVYLTNLNNIGNNKYIIVLYDLYGNEIAKAEQISPVNTKLMGFIFDEPVTNVAFAKIISSEDYKEGLSYKKGFFTKDAYIIAK